jgi:hypothetical protein
VDNGGRALDIVLPDATAFDASFMPAMLNGVVVLRGRSAQKAGGGEPEIVLVPYYAWANRGAGEMKVWFPRR